MGRTTKIIIPVIVLIIVVIGVLALLLASGKGCGSKPAPMSVYYQIGQPIETSQQVFTIVSEERTNQYNRAVLGAIVSLHINAPPGTVFIIVEVTTTNVGDSSLAVSRSDFSLKDSEGREYTTSKYEGLDPYPNRNLPPGQTAYGKIAFLVPDVARGFELYSVLEGTPDVLGVWALPQSSNLEGLEKEDEQGGIFVPNQPLP